MSVFCWVFAPIGFVATLCGVAFALIAYFGNPQ